MDGLRDGAGVYGEVWSVLVISVPGKPEGGGPQAGEEVFEMLGLALGALGVVLMVLAG